MTMKTSYRGIEFTDADVVNMEDFCAAGHDNDSAWLFHLYGTAMGIVFAENEQDALDMLADSGKIDPFLVDLSEQDDSRAVYLGNWNRPFDIERLNIVKLPMPKLSFVSLFNAKNED